MIYRNLLFLADSKVICILTMLTFLSYGVKGAGLQPPPSDPNVISLVLECGEDSLLLCADLNGLSGNLNATNICGTPSFGTLTLENDTCFYYHPDADFFGDDFTCIVVCDDASVCDTFFFEIFVENCVQQIPCSNLNFDLVTMSVTECNDLVKICSPFPLGEALLYDYSINGEPYTGNVGICSFDTLYSYSFSSLPGGGLAGPYELQSWIVDGNVLSGAFDNVFELADLMNMLDPAGYWLLDTATYNVNSFNTASDYGLMTIVQTSTSDISILSKNSTTAPVGSFINLPTGLHDVILRHQIYDYCVDTFTAAIHCSFMEINYDTIVVNQTKTACIDTSNLPGNTESVDQLCNGCQHLSVSQNGACFDYRGISEGTDSLLIVACDDFGFCDSVLQIVTIMDDNPFPIARIDNDTTEENTPVILDLLANDFINGDLRNIFIIIYPQNGIVTISTDFTITYEPEQGFCGLDAFAYEICNEAGCDTSTASILVQCKKPLVYNGFSPNDDGINDTFRIFNLERYPNNSLQVFNRWGNLVYEKSNYQNDWTGKSFDEEILPDGTYYYLFEVDGEKPISGFVQINR